MMINAVVPAEIIDPETTELETSGSDQLTAVSADVGLQHGNTIQAVVNGLLILQEFVNERAQLNVSLSG